MRKKDLDNLEFIRDKFEHDMPDVPDVLDESVIRNKISTGAEHEIIKLKPKFKHTLIKVIGAAACFILIFSVAFSMYPREKDFMASGDSGQVLTFGSYRDVNQFMNQIKAYSIPENIPSESLDGVMCGSELSASSPSFSETYKQEEGVDEAYSIKTDGKYIYCIFSESESKEKICIYRAEGENTELVSTIDVCGFGYYAADMFLYGNRLVVNAYGNPMGDYVFGYDTITKIYDVSNPVEPDLISELKQSGYYMSSRRIDNTVYIISNDDSHEYRKTSGVPKSGGIINQKSVKAENICYFENTYSACFTVISAIDIETGEYSAETKAILGCTSELYCNENNMYFSCYNGFYDSDGEYADYNGFDIIKIELNANEISFSAFCRLKGYINNQFSMDEKDGYLRVAATISRFKSEETTNCLYVLDENMNVVGKTEGFAQGEFIKSARFVKDAAYIITFEETDPLFVIDLSNPEKPEIKGSVEIDGFSSQLVPMDENQILGIGYDLDTSNGISNNGMKLVLFDVSDAEHPKVSDSVVLKDAFSAALNNHNVILVNKEKGYVVLPCDFGMDNTVLTFEIQNGKIEITNKFTVEEDGNAVFSRCVYIGDYIYCAVTVYSNENDAKDELRIYAHKY